MTEPTDQRLGAPDPARYDARQQEIHDAIARGPRGGVRGPLAVWLHRPELADCAQRLGRYCRYDSSLEPRLSELAILVMARIYGAEYEWSAHKPHALKAGLAPDVIDAIRTGATPPFVDDEAAAVHDFARQAVETRQVPDALYDRAVAVLGTDRVVDLVGLLGYYSLISLTLNVFRIPAPDGQEGELG